MAGKKVASLQTAVTRAAAALRTAALEHREDELIGSEDDLIARFNVSRPTFRQAAALVSQEQLVLIRRGVGGGYIATRPDAQATSRMAAVYLHTRKTTTEEIVRSFQPLRIEMARLAAENPDDSLRQEFREFLKSEDDLMRREQATTEEEYDFNSFLKSERDFGKLLERACDNTVLSLFMEIVLDLASMLRRNEDIFVGRPARMKEFRRKRNKIAEAIANGDPEIAVLAARRCSGATIGWMIEDKQRPGLSGSSTGRVSETGKKNRRGTESDDGFLLDFSESARSRLPRAKRAASPKPK